MNLVRDVCSSYDWIESYFVDGTLQTVLSHNDEPTFLQAMSVATSKEHVDLAHEHITQDIATLENALELLRSRRGALHRLSIQHAGALSAFRRLPNEILLEIFLRACGEERFRVPCLHEGPWKLRAVCRKWGSIIEGCSQLWCNMVIDLGYDDVRPAIFTQALQFCGPRPIHMELSLNEDCDYGRVKRRFRGIVLDTIISSSPRWETLSIESYEYLLCFVLELFPRLEHHLPLLRCLKLVGAEDEDIPIFPPTLSALLTAPLLETVYLDLSDPACSAQLLDILPIPWQQIRHLSCNSIKYEPASRHGPLALSKEKFPLLEHCVFISYDASSQFLDQVSASDRLKHDGVVHLVTSRADALYTFSFPSLRTLSLGELDQPQHPHFESDSSAVVFKAASDMLLASRCSLVSLVVSYTFTLVNDFLQILGIISTLEILDMRVAWSNGAARDEVLCKFFTALGNRRNNQTFSFLPALQDLRLSIAAPNWIGNDEWFDPFNPPQPRDFVFVSRVFEAITERSKFPSNFHVFRFKMLTSDTAWWRLSESEIDRLQDLELTKFFLEDPRLDVTDYKEKEEWWQPGSP